MAINPRLLESRRRQLANLHALGAIQRLDHVTAMGDWFTVARERDEATRLLALGRLDADEPLFTKLLDSIERSEEFLDDYNPRGALQDRQSRAERRAARKERRRMRREARKARKAERKRIRAEYRRQRKEIRNLPRSQRRQARKELRKWRRDERRKVRQQRKDDYQHRRQVYKDKLKEIKAARKERKDRAKAGISQELQEVDPETAAAAGGEVALDELSNVEGPSIGKIVGVGVGAVVVIGGIAIIVKRRKAAKGKK